MSLLIFLGNCTTEQSSFLKIQFTKQPKPVWEGMYTAADPSVIRDGDTLRMYYSSLQLNPEKLNIAAAKSVDGITWVPSNNMKGQESIALDINANGWDNHLETVSVLKQGMKRGCITVVILKRQM